MCIMSLDVTLNSKERKAIGGLNGGGPEDEARLKTELLREYAKERDSALKKGQWQWHCMT